MYNPVCAKAAKLFSVFGQIVELNQLDLDVAATDFCLERFICEELKCKWLLACPICYLFFC